MFQFLHDIVEDIGVNILRYQRIVWLLTEYA